MISAHDLAAWLADFWFLGGRISIVCNGMGLLAADAEGYHHFSIMGYSEQEQDLLFDTLTPYL